MNDSPLEDRRMPVPQSNGGVGFGSLSVQQVIDFVKSKDIDKVSNNSELEEIFRSNSVDGQKFLGLSNEVLRDELNVPQL